MKMANIDAVFDFMFSQPRGKDGVSLLCCIMPEHLLVPFVQCVRVCMCVCVSECVCVCVCVSVCVCVCV